MKFFIGNMSFVGEISTFAVPARNGPTGSAPKVGEIERAKTIRPFNMDIFIRNLAFLRS
jgi:hypothetical protein